MSAGIYLYTFIFRLKSGYIAVFQCVRFFIMKNGGTEMNFSSKFIRANGDMCDFDRHIPSPYFRKEFELDFTAEKAEILICGLGFYRLWINGTEITKGALAPYISNTGDICYYDLYNIAALLKNGKNVIGVQLGNGFRNPFGGFIWDFEKMESRGPVCLALTFKAEGGGKELCFEADESFKTHASPVIFDELRMGCRYDARLEIPGWSLPDFDDSGWSFAEKSETPKGKARLCTVPPIVTLREIKPVSVEHFDSLPFDYETTADASKPEPDTVRSNVYVFDFGVNTAGISRLHINGVAGQKITVRHAERKLDGGITVGTTLFKRADGIYEKYLEYGQVDEYICRGGDESFTPVFKYDGFRYAYVEGLNADQITDDTLVLIEQSSEMETRSGFNCSDDTLNKLFEYSRRSDRANFFYFPTDCPHREKNGWTGDASVSSEHFLLGFRMTALLKEWLLNIRCAQSKDGNLPGIVPTGGWGFEWGNGPAWDAVCVNLPYFIYKFDGDTEVIRDNADMIIKYFKYTLTRLNDKGLAEFGLGDWCDPFPDKDGMPSTPLAVTSTAELYDIGAKAAFLFEKAGLEKEAELAREYAQKLRAAFRSNLIDFNTMTVAGDHQTSQAVALCRGLFEKDEIPAARKRLVEIVHRDGDINTCGMIGLRYIFHALTAAGETELAYKIITGKSESCYGYWVEHNATSLWENFVPTDKGGDSQNHHFMGDISSWMLQNIAGIKVNPTLSNISSFEISPEFIPQISSAGAYYDFKEGRLSCGFEKTGKEIMLEITVPEGVSGTLRLPCGYALADKQTHIALSNGHYCFTVCKM